MGMRLIFRSLVVCDGWCVLFGLIGLAGLRNRSMK